MTTNTPNIPIYQKKRSIPDWEIAEVEHFIGKWEEVQEERMQNFARRKGILVLGAVFSPYDEDCGARYSLYYLNKKETTSKHETHQILDADSNTEIKKEAI